MFLFNKNLAEGKVMWETFQIAQMSSTSKFLGILTCMNEMRLDSFPLYTLYDKIISNAKSDTFALMIKGLDRLACIKIGATVSAFFKISKPHVASILHIDDMVL